VAKRPWKEKGGSSKEGGVEVGGQKPPCREERDASGLVRTETGGGGGGMRTNQGGGRQVRYENGPLECGRGGNHRKKVGGNWCKRHIPAAGTGGKKAGRTAGRQARKLPNWGERLEKGGNQPRQRGGGSFEREPLK